MFKSHRIIAESQETIMHASNDVCPVAYLKYSGLKLVEKTPNEILESANIMLQMIKSNELINMEHLTANAEHEANQEVKDVTFKPMPSLPFRKVTASLRILDPKITSEQLKSMNQIEQFHKIMEHILPMGILPYVVKVGLYIPDLAGFKPLNAEYLKFFGLRPPARVCV